jgi:hypothetical protein
MQKQVLVSTIFRPRTNHDPANPSYRTNPHSPKSKRSLNSALICLPNQLHLPHYPSTNPKLHHPHPHRPSKPQPSGVCSHVLASISPSHLACNHIRKPYLTYILFRFPYCCIPPVIPPGELPTTPPPPPPFAPAPLVAVGWLAVGRAKDLGTELARGRASLRLAVRLRELKGLVHRGAMGRRRGISSFCDSVMSASSFIPA